MVLACVRAVQVLEESVQMVGAVHKAAVVLVLQALATLEQWITVSAVDGLDGANGSGGGGGGAGSGGYSSGCGVITAVEPVVAVVPAVAWAVKANPAQAVAHPLG